jgi:hypothetical protein
MRSCETPALPPPMSEFGVVSIDERVILIRIPRLYREGMSKEALYEATRGHWRLGKRRELADYALAVHRGIVLEVFEIDHWQPANTAAYGTRPRADDPRRWEFIGRVAGDPVRSKYLRKSVKHYFAHGNQNPIHYVNC